MARTKEEAKKFREETEKLVAKQPPAVQKFLYDGRLSVAAQRVLLWAIEKHELNTSWTFDILLGQDIDPMGVLQGICCIFYGKIKEEEGWS
jgi:hypothetical protein